MLTKNLLKTYIDRIEKQLNSYEKELEEEDKLSIEEEKLYLPQICIQRKAQRKTILEDAKNDVFKKSDAILKELKMMNDKFVKDNFKKCNTPEYKENLNKFMMLAGGKPNKKVIQYMADNYDLDGLNFLKDTFEGKTKNDISLNIMVDRSITELSKGQTEAYELLQAVEQAKDQGMYLNGLKTLVKRQDDFYGDLPDIKPFTAQEVVDYKESLKAGAEADPTSELRCKLFSQEFRGIRNE